jgi:hypothetical protein
MKAAFHRSILAGLCATATTMALAHHSFTMVDQSRAQLIEGKVVEWHFNSPHVWLYIEAEDAKGEMVRWGVEGAAPVRIVTRGVKGDSFRLGEHVRIVMAPLRDGRPAGGVCFVQKDGGEVLMFNDGSCAAPAVLERWKQNGWLESAVHLEEHPNQ